MMFSIRLKLMQLSVIAELRTKLKTGIMEDIKTEGLMKNSQLQPAGSLYLCMYEPVIK